MDESVYSDRKWLENKLAVYRFYSTACNPAVLQGYLMFGIDSFQQKNHHAKGKKGLSYEPIRYSAVLHGILKFCRVTVLSLDFPPDK